MPPKKKKSGKEIRRRSTDAITDTQGTDADPYASAEEEQTKSDNSAEGTDDEDDGDDDEADGDSDTEATEQRGVKRKASSTKTPANKKAKTNVPVRPLYDKQTFAILSTYFYRSTEIWSS